MDRQTQDRSMKWIIIVGAMVVALLLIGVWSEGFGLYGTEATPEADPNPAVSTNR